MAQDVKTLDEIFTGHYDALVAWCRKRVPSCIGEPEDFVHLAYLRCRKTWQAERQSRGGGAAYVYTSLRWVVLDGVRQYRRRRARERATARRCGPEDRWTLTRGLIATEAVARLPVRPRQVCLGVLAGKPRRQLRAELAISHGTLAVYLSRAKVALTASLGMARQGRSNKAGAAIKGRSGAAPGALQGNQCGW